jgi:CheY-like chemotaxis protein
MTIDAVRVLVVDDEAVILEILQAALEDGGFAVETAASGAAAMQCGALITDVNIERDGPAGWDVASTLSNSTRMFQSST